MGSYLNISNSGHCFGLHAMNFWFILCTCSSLTGTTLQNAPNMLFPYILEHMLVYSIKRLMVNFASLGFRLLLPIPSLSIPVRDLLLVSSVAGPPTFDTSFGSITAQTADTGLHIYQQGRILQVMNDISGTLFRPFLDCHIEKKLTF